MEKDLGASDRVMKIAVALMALFSGIFIVFIGGLADRIGRNRKLTNYRRVRRSRRQVRQNLTKLLPLATAFAVKRLVSGTGRAAPPSRQFWATG